MIEPLPNAFSICPRAFLSIVGSPLWAAVGVSVTVDLFVRVVLVLAIVVFLEWVWEVPLLLVAVTMSLSCFEMGFVCTKEY
jgi:hypothetical protein